MKLPFFPKRPSSLEQEFATDQIRIRLKLNSEGEVCPKEEAPASTLKFMCFVPTKT